MAHRKLAIIGRRVFTGLSVVSLLLCVATLALWVRSYWRLDGFVHHRFANEGNRAFRAYSVFGEVQLASEKVPGRYVSPRYVDPFDQRNVNVYSRKARAVYKLKESDTEVTRSLAGIGFASVDGQDYAFHAVAIPHWFLALLFAILPALHFRAAIRSRRVRREGPCPNCGYDLRATPERCPECGTEKVLATDGAPIRTDV